MGDPIRFSQREIGQSQKPDKAPKLLFVVTEDWYFCSHRLPIAKEARRQGFEVVVATRVYRHGDVIAGEGCKLIPLNMNRGSLKFWKELSALRELIHIYRAEKPDIVHHVAMKPVIYGSTAAWITRIPYVINALAGMGYVFASEDLKARIVRFGIVRVLGMLFKRNCSRLILQNTDDVELLTRARIVRSRDVALIRGSGVDTEVFRPTAETEGIPTVVLISRMLSDKGVGEFVEAARLLKTQGVEARFVLIGDTDSHNPAAIEKQQLAAWHNEGVIEWWGRRDDIPEVLARSHIVCLPSYREGLPKVLLEAASCARPIVTTDTNGCREIVRHGENGFLVPIRRVFELADALKRLIDNPQMRRDMGSKGREMVVREFGVQKVVAETLSVYQELLEQPE
ncbi:MAG: N,N'-diacetylbacillosaminyl-diphospho-undecaprenol alpha-1,3-N-acetylgalactosaminyltransferase [Syntrophorhabdus sp. PtaU1.Bin153]|nr:MAG: N,N'-diacetylbacillosaminyl-diphospho-undecaprenol alpha-1,3-N-acetylgalactosaminyltransferase [Syntrophorhabdus sp. PtaU1.Bin153]